MKVETSKGEITVPDYDKLPTSWIRKNRNLDTSEMWWRVMEDFLTKENLAIFDKLPISEATKIFEKMAKNTGVTLGE